MFEISFETIKQCAKRALDNRIAWTDPDLTNRSQRLLCEQRARHRFIDRWDMRCVGDLITHFPQCVPRRYRRAAITCYLDDDTDTWIVAFTLRTDLS